MCGIAGLFGKASQASVDRNRILNAGKRLRHLVPAPYCVLTLVCVFFTTTGPWGMLSALKQIPEDPWLMVGVPLIVTLVSGTTHCTVMQGEGFGPGSVNAQPATVVVSV